VASAPNAVQSTNRNTLAAYFGSFLAPPVVARLLLACPRLRVLTTSRAVLRVSGEHAVRVLPLDVPIRPSLPDCSEGVCGIP
jgi:hypothetical protein